MTTEERWKATDPALQQMVVGILLHDLCKFRDYADDCDKNNLPHLADRQARAADACALAAELLGWVPPKQEAQP